MSDFESMLQSRGWHDPFCGLTENPRGMLVEDAITWNHEALGRGVIRAPDDICFLALPVARPQLERLPKGTTNIRGSGG